MREPGYGETPLDADEVDALTEQARQAFGARPAKIELYEAEQAIADEISVRFCAEISAGLLNLDGLLTAAFLRDLRPLVR